LSASPLAHDDLLVVEEAVLLVPGFLLRTSMEVLRGILPFRQPAAALAMP
jgi:hypothetical protein